MTLHDIHLRNTLEPVCEPICSHPIEAWQAKSKALLATQLGFAVSLIPSLQSMWPTVLSMRHLEEAGSLQYWHIGSIAEMQNHVSICCPFG